MLKTILFGGESGLSFASNAGLSLLRIFSGIALMLGHGIGKLPPSERFIGAVDGMGMPMPSFFAWSAGLAEFVGGGLLALGLFTRVSAFFIAVTMTVAFFGVHFADPFQRQERALLYLFVALLFMLKGASDWSIDSLIRK